MKPALYLGYFILGFILFSAKVAECITCLNCQNIADLGNCKDVLICKEDEVCYIDKVLSTTTYEPLYNTGCKKMKYCQLEFCNKKAYGDGNSRRKRVTGEDLTLCSQCCYEDSCNAEGCGYKHPQNNNTQCFSCDEVYEGGPPCINTIDCDLKLYACSVTRNPRSNHPDAYALGCKYKRAQCDTFLNLNENQKDVNVKCCDTTLCNTSPYNRKVNKTAIAMDFECPTGIARPTTTSAPTTNTTKAQTTTTVDTTTATTITTTERPTTRPPMPTPTTSPPTLSPTKPSVNTSQTTIGLPTKPPTKQPTFTPSPPTTQPTTNATTTTTKPTTKITTTNPTTRITTTQPTTKTTTTQPTTKITTTQPTTKIITTPTSTLAASTSPPPKTLPPITTTCAVCAGPKFLCEKLYAPTPCPPPNNYCINTITNHKDGTKSVDRACGNFDTCYREWFLGSSDNDKCRKLSDNDEQRLDFQCTFCCIKDNCNNPLHPSDDTLYKPV